MKESPKKIKSVVETRPDLTGRERSVIYLLSKGMTAKHISLILGIDVKTVSNHKRKAMKKIGVSNNIQLCKWLCRNY